MARPTHFVGLFRLAGPGSQAQFDPVISVGRLWIVASEGNPLNRPARSLKSQKTLGTRWHTVTSHQKSGRCSFRGKSHPDLVSDSPWSVSDLLLLADFL